MPTGVYERKPKPRDPMPRFWKFVLKSEGCWEWQGARTRDEYGRFWYKGKNMPAHKFLFEHLHGPLPPGHRACHKCDNPPCVRDDHIFSGTDSDNIQDAVKKGRWAFASYRRSSLAMRGEKNTNAKLTKETVKKIRAEYVPQRAGPRHPNDPPSLRELARKYGVTKFAIQSIVKRLTWNHLT